MKKILSALFALNLFNCIAVFAVDFPANNFHMIDEDPSTGFQIYRMGKPTREDIQKMCRLGVSEVLVMSGNADAFEVLNQADCPSLKVVYNAKQQVAYPLTKNFLYDFDKWVQSARANGKKVAIRCNCGCHRTGRLAAYYQMKYQGLDFDKANEYMQKFGIRNMELLNYILIPQVKALEAYIRSKPCVSPLFCVQPGGGHWLKPLL